MVVDIRVGLQDVVFLYSVDYLGASHHHRNHRTQKRPPQDQGLDDGSVEAGLGELSGEVPPEGEQEGQSEGPSHDETVLVVGPHAVHVNLELFGVIFAFHQVDSVFQHKHEIEAEHLAQPSVGNVFIHDQIIWLNIQLP